MEKIYNKLVRDKIPEIIKNNNEIPITKTLNEVEYKKELENKLLEEYNEVISASKKDDYLEELADMLEVIEALALVQNENLEYILKIKSEKKKKRGGFTNKIFLEKTISKENDD